MDVILYSAPWCGDCRQATRFLARHQIAYREINIDQDAGAADEVVRRTGKRSIPQLVIDGRWVQPYRVGEGFLHDEMMEIFGVQD